MARQSLARTSEGHSGKAISATIARLYGLLQKHETKLSGGEGVLGLYGSLTCKYMHAILVVLSCHTGMGASSTFVDIGHGLGRPLLHALFYPRVAATIGFELDEIKYIKSLAFVSRVLDDMLQEGKVVAKPSLHCQSVTQVGSLSPATHVYTFWEGLSRVAKMAIGRLFRSSPSLKAVAVVQRAWKTRVDPAAKMAAAYGFGPLELVAGFAVKMSGSGRSFTAYIFRKAASSTAAALPSTTLHEEQQPNISGGSSDDAPDDDPDFEEEPTAAEVAAHDEPEQEEGEGAGVDLDLATILRNAAGSACRYGGGSGGDMGADAEAAEEEEYQRLGAGGKPVTEPPRDDAARALAAQEQLFRPSRLAPGYKVSPLDVVCCSEDGEVVTTARLHKRDKHMYICLWPGGCDTYYPLRNLVACEWVEGAYEALAPGLRSRGRQKRGAGKSRVYHVDGDRANNVARNLVLAPVGEPPAPVVPQPQGLLGSTTASMVADADVTQRRRSARPAAVAAVAGMTDSLLRLGLLGGGGGGGGGRRGKATGSKAPAKRAQQQQQQQQQQGAAGPAKKKKKKN